MIARRAFPLICVVAFSRPFDRPAKQSERDPVTALEFKDLAGFVRARNRKAEPLDDLTGGANLLCVARREFAGARPKRILKPDANVAAHRGGHRGDGELIAAGSEHRPSVLRAEETVRRPLHMHDVLVQRADPAKDAKHGLDKERRLDETTLKEVAEG